VAARAHLANRLAEAKPDYALLHPAYGTAVVRRMAVKDRNPEASFGSGICPV
jgi:hypothetical protein